MHQLIPWFIAVAACLITERLLKVAQSNELVKAMLRMNYPIWILTSVNSQWILLAWMLVFYIWFRVKLKPVLDYTMNNYREEKDFITHERQN
ncbi:MAG: hypothetical protein AAF984_09640 [Verrucomicrobiota bacterium]